MDAWNTIQVPLPMRFPGRKYSGTESLLNIMACAAAARGIRCAHTAPQQHGRVGQSPCCKKRFFFWIFYKLKIEIKIIKVAVGLNSDCSSAASFSPSREEEQEEGILYNMYNTMLHFLFN